MQVTLKMNYARNLEYDMHVPICDFENKNMQIILKMKYARSRFEIEVCA